MDFLYIKIFPKDPFGCLSFEMVTAGGRASLSVFLMFGWLRRCVICADVLPKRFFFFKRWVGCGIVLPRFGDPPISTGTWKGALDWLGTGFFHIIILEPWRVISSWKFHVSKWTFISHWWIFRRSKIEDCRRGFRTTVHIILLVREWEL